MRGSPENALYEEEQVQLRLQKFHEKINRSDQLHKRVLSDIKEAKKEYNQKLDDRLKSIEERAAKNVEYGHYTLPSSVVGDVSTLPEKERMERNLRDFISAKKVNQGAKQAEELLKYRRDETIQKNNQRFNSYAEKARTLNQENRYQIRQLNQQHRHQDEVVKSKLISRIEELNAKKETNMLRKLDQE